MLVRLQIVIIFERHEHDVARQLIDHHVVGSHAGQLSLVVRAWVVRNPKDRHFGSSGETVVDEQSLQAF